MALAISPLNRENVGDRQLFVKSVYPEVCVRLRINELNVDSDAVARALDATFKNRCYAKFLSNLRNRLVGVPELLD